MIKPTFDFVVESNNEIILLPQIPYCYGDANDASACQMLGYMLDGFPVYGRCNNDAGVELTSCYTQKADTTGDTEDDYEFSSSGCDLDEANGYTFSDGSYGYVLTDNI